MPKVDLKIRPEFDGFLFLAESIRNPPALPPHRHPELELNLVARGRVTYVVDGRRHDFPMGSLMWFFPGQTHQLVDRTPDAQYYVAVFKPAAIRSAGTSPRYAGLRMRHPEGKGVLQAVLDAPGFDLLRRAMDSSLEGSLPPDLLNREAGYGAFSGFVYRHSDPDSLNAALRFILLLAWRLCSRRGISLPRQELHPGIRKALAVLSDPAFDGRLEDLAPRCGLSPCHLSRLFSSQLGVSLSKYRNSIRLGRFLERCAARPRPTLLEAALGAGFGSYSQFHKIFVEAYGGHPRRLLERDANGQSGHPAD